MLIYQGFGSCVSYLYQLQRFNNPKDQNITEVMQQKKQINKNNTEPLRQSPTYGRGNTFLL